MREEERGFLRLNMLVVGRTADPGGFLGPRLYGNDLSSAQESERCAPTGRYAADRRTWPRNLNNDRNWDTKAGLKRKPPSRFAVRVERMAGNVDHKTWDRPVPINEALDYCSLSGTCAVVFPPLTN